MTSAQTSSASSSGNDNIDGTGNALDNFLSAGSGNNQLDGGGGQ